MSFDLGLTGSIGMGKSTTADLFRDRGCAVWDADAAVHALYAPGGAGTAEIADLVPDAIGADGVDRAALKSAILADPPLLKRIEACIHPLVAAHRAAFRESSTAPIRVFDVPLLFETRTEAKFDATAVVYVDADTQRARVLARPGMTAEALDLILQKQMPSDEKRARADYEIDTSSFETAARDVEFVLQQIRGSDHA